MTLLGVTGSGKTYTAANVLAKLQHPLLVISPNKTLAAQLYSEFKEFFPQAAVHYFVSYYDYYQPEAYVPQTDTYIEKEAQINEEIDRLRHASTQSLLTRNDVIIVASVSCIYGLGSPEEYEKARISISTGDTLTLRNFLAQLVSLQFQRNDIDLRRGTFRVKGDTVEVFPVASDKEWIRVEFFNDTVERITARNLAGTTEAFDALPLFAATHYVAPKRRMSEVVGLIQKELAAQLAALRRTDKLLEAHRLEQRITYDLQMLESVGYIRGIENYSRYFDGRAPGEPPFTLIDFFSYAYQNNWLCMIDESHITLPQIRGMYAGDQSRKRTLIDFGFRLPSALDNRPLTFDEFVMRVPQTLFVSATPEEYEISQSTRRGTKASCTEPDGHELVAEQLIRPTGLLDPKVDVRQTEGQIKDLIREITTRVALGQRTLVTVMTKRMAEDFAEFLRDQNIKAFYIHSDVKTMERVEILDDLRRGTYDVIVGINLLREGLDLPEVSLVAIIDADQEGFLRSKTALIQTMGRAARHADGMVIMYADRMTGAMRYSIAEVERRREIQQAHNLEHGITPRTIVKSIRDPLVDPTNSNEQSDHPRRKNKR
jgi:excinuclease ABC subunit B